MNEETYFKNLQNQLLNYVIAKSGDLSFVAVDKTDTTLWLLN